VSDDFYTYSGGIVNDTTGRKVDDHEISIFGWGVDQQTGQKYWIGRNSWGQYWGENGMFRIVRGIDNLGIESYCTYI
jgi:cathepsin X